VIADRLARLDGVGSDIIEPHGVDRVPGLTIVWDRDKFPIGGLALRQRLLDGEPRIMLDDNSATENSIALDPFQLQPGEAAEIGDAVVRALSAARRGAEPARRPPMFAVTGDWELRVDFLHGVRTHRLAIEQHGSAIAGHQRSPRFEGPLTGALDADLISFAFDALYEASTISYRFEGKVGDGAMAGTVVLGAASAESPGIVNRAQFGTGAWQARRVDG
jgi:hypothetical protein